MKLKIIIVINTLFTLCIFPFASTKAQNLMLENKQLSVQFATNGSIKTFNYGGGKTIEFRNDMEYAGPGLFLSDRRLLLYQTNTQNQSVLEFSGVTDTLAFSIQYQLTDNALAATIKVKNKLIADLEIPDLTFKLGVNTEMDSFPHWKDIFFPTLLRCEKTHFWGYLMNPKGEILVVSSPDAIASWHHDYKVGEHRIFSTNLDLLHALPLPERHPQNLHSLKAGEEKTWTIHFTTCQNLKQVKDIASKNCEAPMIDAQLYTISENESFSISVTGNYKSAVIISPDSKSNNLKIVNQHLIYKPTSGVGKYKLIVTGKNNKIAEAIFTVRYPWSWYMQKARLNALEQEQKGSSHTESWYGLFSAFLAQKYFPNEDLQKKTMDKFNEIYPLMYDKDDLPTRFATRIQNSACMASLLTDMYQLTSDTSYLVKASKICDFLMKNQDETGAYKNRLIHYTSVIYIAKSFMEVCEAEKKLAETSAIWKSRYQKHFESVTRAIDELVLHKDDIQTEGEMTYEDGMISCSYTQISMYALLVPENQRQKYIDAAEYLRKGHRSLSQLIIPDSRMNGGSLRYWESQYDILSIYNLMSSPHGWSAWRVYGLWYLYQLSGNPELIEQVYNALGTDVQVIDENTGKLRWAFCVDPYINDTIFVKDPSVNIRENRGMLKDTIIGEQYIDMISGWYKAKLNTWVTGYWERDGGCCDNDVHEIFKCLEEIVLTNSCVVKLPDNEIKTYNCNINLNGKVLIVQPAENIVKNININNQSDKELQVSISNKTVTVPAKTMMNFNY